MTHEYLNDEGYPTDADIRRLTEWGDAIASEQRSAQDLNDAIDFLRALWRSPEWGITESFTREERTVYELDPEGRYVELSTGSWSGNDALIDAFQARSWRRRALVAHRRGHRGDHYIIAYDVIADAPNVKLREG